MQACFLSHKTTSRKRTNVSLLACLNETFKQLMEFFLLGSHHFGMPLSSQNIAVSAIEFDSFDQAAGSGRHDLEAGSDILHCLMMEGVDMSHVTENRMQLAAGNDIDRMGGFGAVEHAEGVRFVARCGKMLMIRAAQSNVQHLNATANAEHGQIGFLNDLLAQFDILIVAQGNDFAQLGNGMFAIQGGVNVIAAGEDDTIKMFEDLKGALDILIERNDHRDRTGILDGGNIVIRQELPFLTAGSDACGEMSGIVKGIIAGNTNNRTHSKISLS